MYINIVIERLQGYFFLMHLMNNKIYIPMKSYTLRHTVNSNEKID